MDGEDCADARQISGIVTTGQCPNRTATFQPHFIFRHGGAPGKTRPTLEALSPGLVGGPVEATRRDGLLRRECCERRVSAPCGLLLKACKRFERGVPASARLTVGGPLTHADTDTDNDMSLTHH